ncbi:TraB/GumN family protein [Erythrobacter sp. HL-111]|uniref:TraB/GumN family protein n=1 Tax=Erythrobacter sp. HL-111 TaxID=1798193 RepID=UPI0006DA1D75|nr:TraB/GumN family protein [Erythrobacter sp. HL-111]KPP82462.1 MAG: TraB family [Erythrobacteraceae bacterium HL-111]SDS84815.1 TraB family protein [Erythrobacter sp. HL-111]
MQDSRDTYSIMHTRHLALLLAALAAPLGAQGTAQDPAPQSENAILVTAQRSGAPMWTIDTEEGAIILVGEIRAVPQATPWRPDRLEEAVGESQRVILRSRPKFSPGDFFRVMFRAGRFLKLPDKSVAGDYLDEAQRARLAALEAEYDKDYDRSSFLMTGFDLLARRLDFNDDTLDDATEVVKDAAKKADVEIIRPPRFRGEDLLDSLSEADPRSHIPCLEAAMTATEIGPEIIEARGLAWRRFDIPGVMENPLEIALGSCWPWADPQLGEEIRGIWVDSITQAMGEDGVTVAVVPLRVLAEPDGVLDMLEGQGAVIMGPDWRGPDE